MSVAMNCQRMVTRVGEKIENRTGNTWLPTKVLEAIDEAVQHLVILQQESYRDYELDYIDINVAVETIAGNMAVTGQNILEWQLPPLIHKIRRIENTTGGDRGEEIPNVPLYSKEQARNARLSYPNHYWMFTQRSTVNTRIGFVGALDGVDTIRVWFIRRVAPLHYGTAAAPPATTVNLASAAGQKALSVVNTAGFVAGMRVRIDEGVANDETGEIDTVTAGAPGFLNLVNNLSFAHAPADTVRASNVVRFQVPPLPGSATAAGRIVRRDDQYIGVSIEITNDVPAGIVDATAVCRDYLAASRDAVCDGDLVGTAATNGATTTYALVPQIEPEHHELVVLEAAVRLVEEAGSQRTIATLAPKHQALKQAFLDACETRQAQTASYVHYVDDEF